MGGVCTSQANLSVGTRPRPRRPAITSLLGGGGIPEPAGVTSQDIYLRLEVLSSGVLTLLLPAPAPVSARTSERRRPAT